MGNDVNFGNLANLMMGGGNKNKQDNRQQGGNYGNRSNNSNRPNNYNNNRGNNNYNNNRGNNNYNNNRPQGNNGRGNYNNAQGYVGAPYNFVSFSNFVHEYEPEQLVGHGELSDEYLTGEIEYEITAETPIMVSQGSKEKDKPEKFFQNAYGQYAIPGSTMRGLIRNNVQVLGLSSMSDDIDDYALMYRNVANGMERKRYGEVLGSKQITVDGQSVSALLNVKAGYIAKEKDRYVIYQTCKDSIKTEYKEMNYYILSERKIVSNYLLAKKNHGTFAYSFFEKNGKSRMQHELGMEFRKEPGRDGRAHYTGKKNASYCPYYEKISYELAGYKDVTCVGNEGMYKEKGYVLSSGYMNEKKAVYIIPEIDRTKEVLEIPKADINAFQIDYKKRENVLGKDEAKRFFALPKDGEIKPVFYIYLAGRLYFGFTPRLRLFYDHTIKEGLNKNHKDGMLDYAKAMFGYTGKKESYKSRVSFSDAVLVNETKEQEPVHVILGEPKPSSYADYIKPDENERAMTYNNSNFQLRGIKQYWLRGNTISRPIKNFSVASNMQPLDKGSKFRGKVRFKNLTPDELGLLLWSLKLEKNSHMNVGKAKAYGYGHISLQLVEARKVNQELAYKNVASLCLNPWESIAVEELIQTYKSTINKTLAGKKIDELPHVKEFFLMKDASIMPEEDKIRYMDLDAKEYQFRRDRVLPSVKSLVKK